MRPISDFYWLFFPFPVPLPQLQFPAPSTWLFFFPTANWYCCRLCCCNRRGQTLCCQAHAELNSSLVTAWVSHYVMKKKRKRMRGWNDAMTAEANKMMRKKREQRCPRPSTVFSRVSPVLILYRSNEECPKSIVHFICSFHFTVLHTLQIRHFQFKGTLQWHYWSSVGALIVNKVAAASQCTAV